MTNEEIEATLVKAHLAEANKKGATIHNLGWAQTDYGICSKTNKGLLDSDIDPDTLKITHDWTD